MTKTEVYNFLDNLKFENNILPIDESDCREKYGKQIENMETIFDLKNDKDYSYLFAVSEMLASEWNVSSIKNELLEENGFDRKKVALPDWNTKLLISTAFEDNPLFFTMAWNWVQLCEDRIEVKIPVMLVAGTGNKKFGEKTIEAVGTIFLDYKEKYKKLMVGIKLNDEAVNSNLIIKQHIRFMSNGEVVEVTLKTNGEEFIYSEAISLNDQRNITAGVKYLGQPKIIRGEE